MFSPRSLALVMSASLMTGCAVGPTTTAQTLRSRRDTWLSRQLSGALRRHPPTLPFGGKALEIPC